MNLRRWIAALAVLAVFTAVGSAQITSQSLVTCTAGAVTIPNIRSEGLTERVGDLKLTCTGGLAPVTGSNADRITIQVTYGASLTNPGEAGAGTSGGSDIMMVIDEPGTLSDTSATSLGILGYGPDVHGINGVCTTTNQLPVAPNTEATAPTWMNAAPAPCAAYNFLANPTAGYWATVSTAIGGANAVNTYQGVISGSSANIVTFTNVPLVPPITGGVSRVYRIVNARVNPAGTSGAINATVTSFSDVGASTLTVSSAPTQVATAGPSLTTSIATTPVSSCVTSALNPAAGQAKANATYLKFSQSFTTAFKPRVVANSNVVADVATGTGANLNTYALQNMYVEGSYTIGANTVANYSESGVVQNIGPTPLVSGLASSGTRLKAVFAGLDTKATYYVSLNNILDFSDQVATLPANQAGDTTAAPFAVLQTQGSEILGYAASAASAAGPANAAVPVASLTVTVGKSGTGTAEAVWEITNIKASSADTYTFAFYATYPAGVPPAVNPSGQATTNATVALGYAPTTGTAATTPPGVTTTWIPRFVAPAAGAGFFSVLPCQTTLLFPYVISSLAAPGSAWQTGVAIENTGADPLGTVGTTGPCTLSFYGAGAPPAVTTAAIAPGSAYTFLVTDPGGVGANTNWNGYIFAVCNFNFAHGFAFIEDPTRLMAMGYLGTVLNSQSSFVQRGSFTLGEQLEH